MVYSDIFLKSALPTFSLKNARVLVRADLNVPLENGTITSDFRLKHILPTIDFILKKGGKVILLTHIGRPLNQDPMLSTQHLIPWFKQKGYSIAFANTFADALKESKQQNDRILLFENLRFFAGEKQQDEQFARSLAELGDYYVNDAFGTMHRSDCSVSLLPRLFAQDRRTIGFLIEHELQVFGSLAKNPEHPFLLILGGAKASDKIPLLEHLLPSVDTILLGPAVVFSCMHALGESTGQSLVDTSAAPSCKTVIADAQSMGKKIFFPIDYQICLEKLGSPTAFVPANEIPEKGIGVNIGPESVALFAQEIEKAATIFFNGLMGLKELPKTLEATEEIFKAMVRSRATTIIGGGDTVAAAEKLGYSEQFSHCSTGGGALLALITGQELPGIAWALKDRAERKQ